MRDVNNNTPTFSAHHSYITAAPTQPCGYVHRLPDAERCDFVNSTSQCHQSTYIISYINFLYCYMHKRYANYYFEIGTAAIVLWLVVLLIVLSTVTLKFYKPACILVAKNMNMSPQLAGLTILIFGNNISEAIVPAFRYQNDTEIVFTEIMGSSIFLATFVSGLGICLQPFLLVRSQIITCCVFHLASIILIIVTFSDDKLSIAEVFLFYLLYVAFVISVFFDYAMLSKRGAMLREQRPKLAPHFANSPQSNVDVQTAIFTDAMEIFDKSGQEVFDVERTKKASFHGVNKDSRLFEQFVSDIRVICFENYENAGWLQRSWQYGRLPIKLFLALCIPMTNFHHPMHGWSKLKFMLNIFLMPLLVLVTVGLHDQMVAEVVPLYCIFLFISSAIVIIVYKTTRTDTQPRNFTAIALMSYIGCIFTNFFVISEINSALVTFGNVLNISHTSTGFTVLAWGNSLIDIITNTSIVRSGYVRMAFSASFAGPFFNMLLGLGVSYTIALIKHWEGSVKARKGANGSTILVFYVLSIACFLVSILLTNFQARRSIGVLLVVLYFMFLLYSLLCELEIIHAFGTDHVDDAAFDNGYNGFV